MYDWEPGPDMASHIRSHSCHCRMLQCSLHVSGGATLAQTGPYSTLHLALAYPTASARECYCETNIHVQFDPATHPPF